MTQGGLARRRPGMSPRAGRPVQLQSRRHLQARHTTTQILRRTTAPGTDPEEESNLVDHPAAPRHHHAPHRPRSRHRDPPARKTTELIAYVAAVLAVAVTAFVVGDDGENTVDPFSAEQALRYITFLTIGYLISRGLAKSGSRGTTRDND